MVQNLTSRHPQKPTFDLAEEQTGHSLHLQECRFIVELQQSGWKKTVEVLKVKHHRSTFALQTSKFWFKFEAYPNF